MKKFLTLLLALILVVGGLGINRLNADAATFTDVNQDYAFNAIERWASYGVISGRGNRIFDPYSNTTRAEFASMINNIMGYVSVAPVGTFADVPSDAGMYGNVLRATHAGVFSAGGNFRPGDYITRAEAAMAMLNMLGIPYNTNDTNPTHFIDDALFTPQTRGAIRAAYNVGLILGIPVNNDDGTRQYRFAPDDRIIRKHLTLLFDNIIGALVSDSTPLTGNVQGFVIVRYPAAVLSDAVVSGNVIITEAARGGEVLLVNSSIAGTLRTQVADLAIVINGNDMTINFVGVVYEITLNSNAGNLNVAAGSVVRDLIVFGQNVNLSNDGVIVHVHLHEPAAGNFVWMGNEPHNTSVFEELPALVYIELPEDDTTEYDDADDHQDVPAITTGRRPMIPVIPTPPPGQYTPVQQPPQQQFPQTPPQQPPAQQREWRNAVASEFNMAVEFISDDIGDLVALIVVQIPGTQASGQWISGVPNFNQHRFLVNGTPTRFYRHTLYGVVQYRIALDLVCPVDENVSLPRPTVSLQFWR